MSHQSLCPTEVFVSPFKMKISKITLLDNEDYESTSVDCWFSLIFLIDILYLLYYVQIIQNNLVNIEERQSNVLRKWTLYC